MRELWLNDEPTAAEIAHFHACMRLYQTYPLPIDAVLEVLCGMVDFQGSYAEWEARIDALLKQRAMN